MKKNKIISALSALAAAAALSLPAAAPAAAQQESAAHPPPSWFCHKMGNGRFDLSCSAVCIAASGNFPPIADGEVVSAWDCPGSDVRENCDALSCSSIDECQILGVTGYESCHHNGKTECAAQAQAATGAECVPPANGG